MPWLGFCNFKIKGYQCNLSVHPLPIQSAGSEGQILPPVSAVTGNPPTSRLAAASGLWSRSHGYFRLGSHSRAASKQSRVW